MVVVVGGIGRAVGAAAEIGGEENGGEEDEEAEGDGDGVAEAEVGEVAGATLGWGGHWERRGRGGGDLAMCGGRGEG